MTKSQAAEQLIQKNYETSILESTIIKIGALLALGFGEAGSAIVAKNLKQSKIAEAQTERGTKPPPGNSQRVVNWGVARVFTSRTRVCDYIEQFLEKNSPPLSIPLI